MSGYLMPVVVSILLFVSGCSLIRGSEDAPSQDVSTYSGETEAYEVQVRIVEVDGRCSERRITLQRRSKLHLEPTVHRVVAHDRNCNEQIDRMEFRDPEDQRRVSHDRLVQDIWHAFGRVVPIDKQMG